MHQPAREIAPRPHSLHWRPPTGATAACTSGAARTARPDRPTAAPADRPAATETGHSSTELPPHGIIGGLKRSVVDVGERPSDAGAARPDDGPAGGRAARPERGRVQPFQHGRTGARGAVPGQSAGPALVGDHTG